MPEMVDDVISGMNFSGLKLGRLYKIKKYNFETVTGNPVVCLNSAKAPLKNLRIFGKSTQISTTGAQLLPLVDIKYSANGINWECKDGIITVNGVTKQQINGNEADFYIVGGKAVYEETKFEEGTVFFKVEGAPATNCFTIFVVKDDTSVIAAINATNIKQSIKFVHKKGSKYRIMLRNTTKAGTKIDISDLKIMFNQGSDYLPWEPYTGGKPSPSLEYPQEIKNIGETGEVAVRIKSVDEEEKVFLVKTEDGLLGIPSLTEGNFVDEHGQKWFCDEINFELGVKVKRVEKIQLNDKMEILLKDVEVDSSSKTTVRRFEISTNTLFDARLRRGEMLCRYFINETRNGIQCKGICFTYVKKIFLYPCKEGESISLEEFKEWISSHEVICYCALQKPVIVKLTDEELANYKAMRTYKGTTIFSSETDIEITYKKND